MVAPTSLPAFAKAVRRVIRRRKSLPALIGMGNTGRSREACPREGGERESSPSAAHFRWLALPGFAGMTAPGSAPVSQTTPVPPRRGGSGSVWPVSLRTVLIPSAASYPPSIVSECTIIRTQFASQRVVFPNGVERGCSLHSLRGARGRCCNPLPEEIMRTLRIRSSSTPAYCCASGRA